MDAGEFSEDCRAEDAILHRPLLLLHSCQGAIDTTSLFPPLSIRAKREVGWVEIGWREVGGTMDGAVVSRVSLALEGDGADPTEAAGPL